MTPWHRFTQMVHLVCLGLWLGTAVMSSAAAFVIFPMMKNELQPQLPAFANYDGPHWLLAAGRIAEEVFLIGDTIQFPCALLAAITMGLLVAVFRIPRLLPSTALRILALTVAIGAFGSQLLVVTQSMNAALRLYRAAALAGDNDAALRHQTAFNELHPIASTLMAITMVAVFIALAAGTWAAGPTPSRNPRAAATPSAPTNTPLEEPRLLKGRR